MIDEREALEKELERLTPEPGMVERVVRRRERKVRRQRVAAGALGVAIAIAVSVPAVTIVMDSNSDSGVTPPPELEARTIYLLDPNNGRVSTLFSSPVRVANAERSPVSDQVVYERTDGGGQSQIFVLEPDGTELQLTDLSGGAFEPTWSSDGGRIAFTASMTPGEDTDIFVMDADGSQIRRLAGTAGPDGSPDWSPDGTRIVFHTRSAMTPAEDLFRGSLAEDIFRGTGGRIWVVTIRTGALSPLAQNEGMYAEVDPAWSPDGRWIAFSSVDTFVNSRVIGTTLRVIRPDGTQARLVWRWGRQIENPSWSPDGRFIVMEVNDAASGGIRWDWTTGRGDIAIVDVQTGRIRWIQREPPFDPHRDGSSSPFDQPSWGADGILVTLSPAGQV